MSFLYGFLLSAICLIWAFVYMKTYQLVGYKMSNFIKQVWQFKLSFGDKNRLQFTKRMIRFVVLYFLIIYGLLVIICKFSPHWALIILNFIVIFLFTPILIVIVHYIIWPLEHLIKCYYIQKASKKLGNKKIIKIGITGSYGKTSTKNILAQILEKEYKVCVTPASYNTEMGICKTVLENLDDEDVFIAEMGARHIGDIKKLCKIVKPQHAILTTVGKQHIETFKTLENIEKTKFELLDNLQRGGFAVINGDSPSNIKLYNNCTVPKFLTCKEGGFAYATDEHIDKTGSAFTLVIDGTRLPLKTKLLGKCNIDNIVSACALAYLLGVSLEDIKSAVASLEPTPHRLQLISKGKICIIDDSYNSNVVGSAEALKVLSCFEGRKIVITPGFVEMGQDQSMANFKFGGLIADSADYVIVMNETNKNDLLSGLISHNFKQNHIFFAKTRQEQQNLIKKLTCENCVILFENDLPDNFE